MNDSIKMVLLKQPHQKITIGNIPLDKAVVRTSLNIAKIGKVSGIGQLVKIGNRVRGITLQEMADNVRPDKTCPSRNQNMHQRNCFIMVNTSGSPALILSFRAATSQAWQPAIPASARFQSSTPALWPTCSEHCSAASLQSGDTDCFRPAPPCRAVQPTP